MSRDILTLKKAPPEETSAALPPRPAKRDQPLNQLLTFIVLDRKPYHHASYADATMEREYLEAAAKLQPRNKKGRWVSGPQNFKVMKVLNLSGAELEGKILVLDPAHLDQAGIDAACAAYSGSCEDIDRENMAVAVRAYLNALKLEPHQ